MVRDLVGETTKDHPVTMVMEQTGETTITKALEMGQIGTITKVCMALLVVDQTSLPDQTRVLLVMGHQVHEALRQAVMGHLDQFLK
jgi:hypothetical protein